MYLFVDIIDVHNVLNNLKNAYIWLYDVMSDLWATIYNNPLLMTVTIIFLVLTSCSVIGLLIVSIAPSVYGKSYSNSFFEKYPNPNKVYSRFSKNGLIYSVYDVLLKRKKQKEKEDEAAQAAYEKIVEEQEALQHKHDLYDKYKPMADTYFNNYPFRHSVNIDGVTYFNPDSKNFKPFKNSSKNVSFDIDDAIDMAENDIPKYKKK